jgi:hypothetical protein
MINRDHLTITELPSMSSDFTKQRESNSHAG